MDEYEKTARALLDFIARSPTAYHTAENLAALYAQNGFVPLREDAPWSLAPGGRYFVRRGGAALLAFVLPAAGAYEGVHLVASHSDTPAFKLKPNPECAAESAVVLNTEGYGSMLCAPWFDRPLGIAGRAVVRTDGALETRCVDFGRDMVLLASLAIHMDRDANKGHAIQLQKELLPLWAEAGCTRTLQSALAEQLCVAEADILDSELFLYCRTPGSIWGAQNAFLSAPRLDDTLCTFAAAGALLGASHPTRLCMAAVFGAEEVGSGTRDGALSTLLADTLRRIALALGMREEQQYIALAKSCALSADNGHAVHPNWPEKADRTNRPHLGGGVLLKYAANQKYTTDAETGALVRALCAENDIPLQVFANHSDVPGGSTLGNLSVRQVPLPTADIGAAQLAMHSPYETCSVRDALQLQRLMHAFYGTQLA